MDWQITSAILSAVAAVLGIAELIYRHAQIKKLRGTQHPSQNIQYRSGLGMLAVVVNVSRDYIKKSKVFAVVNKTVKPTEHTLYKKLQGVDYNRHSVDSNQQRNLPHMIFQAPRLINQSPKVL